MKIKSIDDKVLSYEIVVNGNDYYHNMCHDGELRESRPYLSVYESSYHGLICDDKELMSMLLLQGKYGL